MCRLSAVEGFTVFHIRAAAHGWRALTFPLAPFRSHTGSGRGDVWSGLRDALSWAVFLFHAGRGREHVGRGVNVTHPTCHGQRQTLPARQRERIEEQNVGPPMQWLHRHGTFSIRNPGF